MFSSATALAATPTLTVSSANSGSVFVNVSGDSNSSIVLYYYGSGGSYNLQTRNIGTTDYSGHFSTYIDTYSYGVNPGSLVYVMVNNQQSNSVTWPYSGSTGGQISLSQTNLTLSRGQSANVSVYGVSNAVGYNPNSNIIALSVSGNQVTVTGNNSGSVTIPICDQGFQSNCANLYVTVQDGNSQSISFSQNNVTIYSGQPTNISIYGSGSYYYISNNSNPNAVTANISGSIITLTANGNSGSATISVCSQSYGCGSLYVTSNGGYGGYGLGLTYPTNFQITHGILNRSLSQYGYVNSVEAQAGDIVEFEIRIQTNNYQTYQNSGTLVADLRDTLPSELTYLTGSTKVNGYTVVDGITSVGIYLNNFYPGQEQVVKFSAMVNSNLYSETLTNQILATMNGSTQTSSSYVVIRSRGTVLGAADIVTGDDGTLPMAVFFGLMVSMPVYYFLFYRKFIKGKKVVV